MDTMGSHWKTIDGIANEEIHAPISRDEKCSDVIFEHSDHLDHLGEGAGSAVHKVKDKQHNVVMVLE